MNQQDQLKTPGALQMFVNLLRRGAGSGDQQTPGRAVNLDRGQELRFQTGEMSPEEARAYEMQKQEAMRRNQMLMGR